MIKYLLPLVLGSVGAVFARATPAFDTSRDEKTGFLVFRGAITFNDLIKETAFPWMAEGIAKYQPDSKVIAQLAGEVKNCRFLVFMGTWCDDSQNIIPKFVKTLQDLGYPTTDVLLYGLDRPKTSGTGMEKTYGVSLVPTIIVYYNDKEIGRIVESIQTTVEGDLAKIISTRQH